MWNVNIKSGSIWTVKSINELDYDEQPLQGMRFGIGYVLILSAFTDIDNTKKFTYLKVFTCRRKNKTMMQMDIKNKTYYIELDELKTGDQRSLDTFICKLDLVQTHNIVKAAKDYFNLNSTEKRKNTNIKHTDTQNTPKIKLHKFGIDVIVIESDDVKVDTKNRILLSPNAKQDIIHSLNTDQDITNLCNKYNIFPARAMKEIKTRLVYKYKHRTK